MQEVAFTFANAIAYVEAARDAGLDVNAFGQRLSFFFNAHNDFLEEVAKFRAARRLWARIMRDRFGATNPRAQQLRFHTQTAGSTLTAQQPDNNIVRVAMQALAAVLGGTQSLHCNGRDEALALPTEESARIALRTQQIIAFESGVANTVDPLGGAWAIEQRTNRIERKARRDARAHRCAGGTLAAIEQGLIQREIQDAAYAPSSASTPRRRHRRRRERLVRRGERTDRGAPDRSGSSSEQRGAWRRVRAARDQAAWRAALDGVVERRRSGTQPRAADHRRRRGAGDRGRDRRCAARVFGEHKEIDVWLTAARRRASHDRLRRRGRSCPR